MPAAPRLPENLATSSYRLNRDRELVPLDRLPQADQDTLAGLDVPRAFGVVRRAGEVGAGRVVTRDEALVLLSLCTSGPLPWFARRGPDAPEIGQQVMRLVLDGVLEVERDGAWVSGPKALRAAAGTAEPGGKIVQLSLRAIEWAAALGLPGSRSPELVERLYRSNTMPLSPALARRWPDQESTAGWLDSQVTVSGSRSLKRSWQEKRPVSSFPWRSFSRRGKPARGPDRPTFKLYVSPLPDALPTTWGRLIDTLPATKAFAFKVGPDAPGLLRPDKIVVYFESFEALSAAVPMLEVELRGLPAQGVPFTAEIAGDGLLSWGLDPPSSMPRATSWNERESWRSRVVSLLAAALGWAAEQTDLGMPIGQAALERVRFEGVDTETWVPAQAQYQRWMRREGALA